MPSCCLVGLLWVFIVLEFTVIICNLVSQYPCYVSVVVGVFSCTVLDDVLLLIFFLS